MSMVYFRRNAKSFRDPKSYLPDLPVLSRLLSRSWKYEWNDACFRKVYLLGKAAEYPFSTFLAELELPHPSYGSCSANLISLDTITEEWSLDSSASESCGKLTLAQGVPWCLSHLIKEGIMDGPVAPSSTVVGVVGGAGLVCTGANLSMVVREGIQMTGVGVARVPSDGSSPVALMLDASDGAMVQNASKAYGDNGVSLVGSGVYLGFGVLDVLDNGVSLMATTTHVLGTSSGAGICRPSWTLMRPWMVNSDFGWEMWDDRLFEFRKNQLATVGVNCKPNASLSTCKSVQIPVL
ncbi:hypothetical protein M758_UG279600 [Ceratodon purpureus]|nr:hypothetical protein M758_UG279600 [Ceratodon purpureus]